MIGVESVVESGISRHPMAPTHICGKKVWVLVITKFVLCDAFWIHIISGHGACCPVLDFWKVTSLRSQKNKKASYHDKHKKCEVRLERSLVLSQGSLTVCRLFKQMGIPFFFLMKGNYKAEPLLDKDTQQMGIFMV